MPFDAASAIRPRRFRAPDGLAELLRLAWPVVLGRVGIMTMGLTDAVVVGRFSGVQLGWHALAWAPAAALTTTGVGLLFGVQVMTARRVGEGRRDLAGAALRRGLIYALAAGAVGGGLLALFGPAFLRAIGLQPDLAAGAAQPLRIFSLSLPVYLASVACTYFLEGLGKPMPGMVAMWLANLVNLLANLWLVPGHSGLPVEGAAAAAWATFISRSALAIALLVWIARMPEARALGVFAKPKGERHAAREQVRIGLGAGASTFIEMSAFSGMTLIMGRVGGLEAAAWSIALNVTALVFMVPLGLSTATGVLVGRAFGARDSGGVRAAGLMGLGVTAALTLTVAAFVWPSAGLIAHGYVSDPTLAAMAGAAIALSAVFFVPDGLQVVAAQSLRARGDVWVPTAFHLTSYAVIMLPLGWLLGEHLRWGVIGAVWAVIVASLVSASLLATRFWALGRVR